MLTRRVPIYGEDGIEAVVGELFEGEVLTGDVENGDPDEDSKIAGPLGSDIVAVANTILPADMEIRETYKDANPEEPYVSGNWMRNAAVETALYEMGLSYTTVNPVRIEQVQRRFRRSWSDLGIILFPNWRNWDTLARSTNLSLRSAGIVESMPENPLLITNLGLERGKYYDKGLPYELMVGNAPRPVIIPGVTEVNPFPASCKGMEIYDVETLKEGKPRVFDPDREYQGAWVLTWAYGSWNMRPGIKPRPDKVFGKQSRIHASEIDGRTYLLDKI